MISPKAWKLNFVGVFSLFAEAVFLEVGLDNILYYIFIDIYLFMGEEWVMNGGDLDRDGSRKRVSCEGLNLL